MGSVYGGWKAGWPCSNVSEYLTAALLRGGRTRSQGVPFFVTEQPLATILSGLERLLLE